MRQLAMRIGVVIVLASTSGCARWLGLQDNRGDQELTKEFALSERRSRESRTLSDLASLQKSIADYVRAEGRIPTKLDQLIPKYAAEIPISDTGLPRHRVNANVIYYPSDTIRDGVVDGSRLRDTGHWGYAYNDRQVILFVDCTHQNSRNHAWYQEVGY